jgi:hypothetical protein
MASASWLAERGYYRQLLHQYVSSGWLESPAHGVYRRPGPPLKWQQVVISLLIHERMPLHIGGTTALAHAGFTHYIPMQGAETIKLYGPVSMPAWTRKLAIPETFMARNDAMFGALPLPRVALEGDGSVIVNGRSVSPAALAENGLRVERWGDADWPLVYSTHERAILEVLQDVPQQESFHAADLFLQGLSNLRPKHVSTLLKGCQSVKVKRLFLALAERHGHAWFKHLDLSDVSLGAGKRMLAPGGKLHPEYLITLPADLDDHA